jgi:hypothetical protein
MTRHAFVVPACLTLIGAAAVAGAIALAQPGSGAKPPAAPAPGRAMPPANTPPAGAPQLPAGWTPEDMQACIAAGTPGPMHKFLAEGAGSWTGKNTMWMAPDAPPVVTDCSSTVTTIMGGRFTKCEMSGDMPGMGPFMGLGMYGFDNVTQKFQSSWIDNEGTGMMFGTGELSSDGKTLTWNYSMSCPLTKKATTMREIEKITGKDTRTLEMFGADPKTGKEFKMMEIVLTRKPAATIGGK